LVGAGSVVAIANLSARLLTNPKVVDWLAKTSTREKITPLELTRLGVLYNELPDEETKRDLTAFIQSMAR
jgi:hypothetical protein